MQITLENGHSIIRVANNKVKSFQKTIDELIQMFGGEEIKKSSRYTYWKIYEDILNRKEVI